MNGVIIIVGHGNYADGIKSSVEQIAGRNEGIEYINFLAYDSEEVLRNKMQQLVERYKGCKLLFVCDLLGGTPFKTAVQLSMDNANIEVVAGCNISSIVEVIFLKDETEINELADMIISSSIKSTVKFNKKTIKDAAGVAGVAGVAQEARDNERKDGI